MERIVERPFGYSSTSPLKAIEVEVLQAWIHNERKQQDSKSFLASFGETFAGGSREKTPSLEAFHKKHNRGDDQEVGFLAA